MMNVKAYGTSGFTATLTLVTVTLQSQLSLMGPIRSVIRFIATVIVGRVSRVVPNVLIPAFRRTKTALKVWASDIASRTTSGIKRFAAVLTGFSNRHGSTFDVWFASFGLTDVLAPFWSMRKLLGLVSNAFAVIRTIMASVRGIRIHFLATNETQCHYSCSLYSGRRMALLVVNRATSRESLSLGTARQRTIALFQSRRSDIKSLVAYLAYIEDSMFHRCNYTTGVM